MACDLEPNQQKHISHVDLCKTICQIVNCHYLFHLYEEKRKNFSFALTEVAGEGGPDLAEQHFSS